MSENFSTLDKEIVRDDPKATPAAPPGRPKKKVSRGFLVIGALVVLVICLALYFINHGYESTDDAFIEAHVMQISPKISEKVFRVWVKDNQEVKKGDLLVELDAGDNLAIYHQAQANLASSEAKLVQAKAQLASNLATLAQNRASTDESKAAADNAAAEMQRSQGLKKTGVISQRDFDTAQMQALSTKAAVNSAWQKASASESDVSVAEAQVKSEEAQVEQAKALLDTATLRLSYTKLYAPEDGRVTRKNVEVGNYVQSGSALMAVVSHEVWVVANYKETQLNHMRPGQPVKIRVDAYPELRLEGKVDSIQAGTGARFSLLPAENATGNFVKVVQRDPVKILITNMPKNAPLLAPGMSVVPTVNVR